MIAAPPPYRDELLGSALIRACRHYRMNPQALMQHCLGHNGGSNLLYCRHLPELSKLFNMPAEGLAWRHTTLPFCTAALFEWQEAKVLDELSENSVPSSEATSYLITQRSELKSRMFCLDCVADDLRRAGESFWHRCHHLPLVAVCPIHGLYLVRSSIKIESSVRLLPQDCSGEPVLTGRVAPVLLLHALLAYGALVHRPRRSWVAHIVSGLLRSKDLDTSGVLSPRMASAMRASIPADYWSLNRSAAGGGEGRRWLPMVQSHFTSKYLLLEAVRTTYLDAPGADIRLASASE